MMEDEKRACRILFDLIQDFRSGEYLPNSVLRLYIEEHQESDKENINSYHNLLKELFHVMKRSTSRIKKIVLEGKLYDGEFRNFISAIINIETLESLQIYKVTSLSNEAFSACIVNLVKNNNSIEELNVSCNNIDDACCVAIAESMKYNKTIKELILCQNNIGNDGCVAMAKLLKNNKTLNSLILNSNKIGDFGCIELAKVLKEQNNALETLMIPANNIGDKGAVALAEMIKVNSTLLHLHLSRNNICDVGFVALANALKYNNSLKKLYYFENQVSCNGISTMRDVLCNNNFSLHLFKYDGVDPEFFSLLNQNREYCCQKFIHVNMNKQIDLTRDHYINTMIRGCQLNRYRKNVVTNILYNWVRQNPSLVVDDQFIQEAI